jgi:putative transposase
MSRPHSRTLRTGRWSAPGQVYLVTAVTAARRACFADFDVGCAAARAISSDRAWPTAKLLAWVLMPDHAHLLIELVGKESLSLVVGRAKAIASAEVRRSAGLVAIWQPGFHDHALRTEESVRQAARYLVANPLRAGLVTQIGEYPFWDSVWLEETLRARG